MSNPLRMPSESGSIVQGFQSLITPDVTSRTSFTLGESEIAVQRGWNSLIPVIFGTIAARSGDRSFMNKVMDMTRDSAADSSILHNVSSYVSSGNWNQGSSGLSHRFMSMLFGRDMDSVTTILTNVAGIQSSTAASMVGMAGPLALAYLGRTIRAQRLDTSGLSDMLDDQRSSIMAAVPGAFYSLVTTAGRIQDDVSRPAETAVRKTSAWRWIVAIGIGVFLLWALTRTRPAVTVPTDIKSVTGAAVDTVTRMLPGGASLQYLRTGIEGQMLAFIENPTMSPSRESWFNFDRLLFETNSAVLKPESQPQLRNIAEILRAYPNVRVKIGGYTDNSGDANANLQLSQDRANSVMAALINLGVSPERVTAEGYGQLHPVATNLTDEGRAQNRRVALRVTAK